jgi:hypothetical protein
VAWFTSVCALAGKSHSENAFIGDAASKLSFLAGDMTAIMFYLNRFIVSSIKITTKCYILDAMFI